jgi:hypothetical protein
MKTKVDKNTAIEAIVTIDGQDGVKIIIFQVAGGSLIKPANTTDIARWAAARRELLEKAAKYLNARKKNRELSSNFCPIVLVGRLQQEQLIAL